MFKQTISILFCIFFITSSYAETINKIDVTGNKRISKESLEQIKKINLNNNNIIKPYLWKIK